MHLKETFRLGVAGLLGNKTRTVLTMLGIIFGVASVIAMMSIGEGARQETLQQIELLGTNNILINRLPKPQKSEGQQASFSLGLSLQDAGALAAVNPYIDRVTPVRSIQEQVGFRSMLEELTIIGTTPGYPETFNSVVLAGSFFKEFHMNDRANVCIIGSGIKKKFFPFENPLQHQIKIGGQWFQVIGVIAPKNISSAGMKNFGLRDFNNDIYIPFSTMAFKFTKVEVNNAVIQQRGRRGMRVSGNNDDEVQLTDKESVDQLTVKIKQGHDLREAAHLITRTLERRHFGVADYEVILPEQLLEQKQKTQRIFNIVMGAIAGISLLVGGIGIMNIMLANIMERTKEIGIRRAIGATRVDVLAQFLFEAVLISITGGILGIATGFLMTRFISNYAGWNTVISVIAIITSFFVAVATGVIFGIYPAKKAADKDPIEALRYE